MAAATAVIALSLARCRTCYTSCPPGRSRDNPQSILVPVALNGVFDTKKARDFFAFDVRAGERLVFDVDSMKLGFLDDPLVAVYTLDGKLLASHDDRLQQNGDEPPNLDSYLV